MSKKQPIEIKIKDEETKILGYEGWINLKPIPLLSQAFYIIYHPARNSKGVVAMLTRFFFILISIGCFLLIFSS